MNEGKEQTAVSDTPQELFQKEYYSRINRLALMVLESHDDLDEHFQGMSTETRIETAESVIYSRDLQGIPVNLLIYHIERYFEVYRKPITIRPFRKHHFYKPFDECFQTYRSGFFIACTMMTQSINEGIINFVAERNSIKAKRGGNLPLTIGKFVKHGLFTNEAAQASKVICERDERNDLHHMKPEISQIEDWHKLAKRNLRNLKKVESCVFGYDFEDKTIRPHHPQHWEKGNDNLIQGLLRFG